jgi:dTDP-L-rhamnose 4-epimerase
VLLITGGAGFIGSHIAEAARDAGLAVRVLDRQRGHLDARAEFVAGDVRDERAVERALDGIDRVSHQAAKVGLGTDIGDIADYAAHNDVGTAVLLRALARRSFSGRLVLASSMVVYGEGRYRCAEHGLVRPPPRRAADLAAGRFEPPCPVCGGAVTPEAIAEDAPADPRNVYAATKLHQEHLAAAFARETGVPVTALRYHNVYGPRMPRDTPYAGVAAIFAGAVAAGRAPRVFEDGRQLRDFVHVRDVARANVLALMAPEPVPGAFNVCSGTPRSIGEMATALSNGGPVPQVTGDYRLGDVRHVFADATRACNALGFRATEDFAAGMAELSLNIR